MDHGQIQVRQGQPHQDGSFQTGVDHEGSAILSTITFQRLDEFLSTYFLESPLTICGVIVFFGMVIGSSLAILSHYVLSPVPVIDDTKKTNSSVCNKHDTL